MAYGARLESVLGASPQGFESLILRQLIDRLSGGLFVLLAFTLIRTWSAGPIDATPEAPSSHLIPRDPLDSSRVMPKSEKLPKVRLER